MGYSDFKPMLIKSLLKYIFSSIRTNFFIS